jgi:hypothetical protein
MKVYKNFGELKFAPNDIYKYFLEMECNEPPIDKRLFMDYYGGDVHVIETIEDLEQINTTQANEDETEWLSITETPDSFDSCRYIYGGRWVEIYSATTDSGGPSYFIPREIADQCFNVARSIEMSNEAWS